MKKIQKTSISGLSPEQARESVALVRKALTIVEEKIGGFDPIYGPVESWTTGTLAKAYLKYRRLKEILDKCKQEKERANKSMPTISPSFGICPKCGFKDHSNFGFKYCPQHRQEKVEMFKVGIARKATKWDIPYLSEKTRDNVSHIIQNTENIDLRIKDVFKGLFNTPYYEILNIYFEKYCPELLTVGIHTLLNTLYFLSGEREVSTEWENDNLRTLEEAFDNREIQDRQKVHQWEEYESIDKFTEKYGITITSSKVETNPNNKDFRGDHWKVTLKYNNRTMGLFYSKGHGFEGAEPTAEEVLDCIASDVATIENTSDFEEWSAELGFDSDSRTAARIYKLCVAQTDQLQLFLGESIYNELLWETERQ